MVFTYREEYFKEYNKDCVLLDRVDFYNGVITDMLIRIGASHSEELCRALNSINNQGITEVNAMAGWYKIKDEIVPLASLSSGERIFFVAAMADILHRKVGFGYCIRQLTKTTFKKFGKLFKDTTYVMVVGDDSIWRDMYHDACIDK